MSSPSNCRIEDDEHEASAIHRAWAKAAEDLRKQLVGMIPFIPAMKVDEAKAFVETLEAARLMEWRAELHDKWVELELAKVTAE